MEGQASTSRSGLGLRAIMINSFNIFELFYYNQRIGKYIGSKIIVIVHPLEF